VNSVVRSPRFEPGSSAWQSITWSSYREYLSRLYGKQYTSLLYSYAAKYHEYLEEPSKINSLPASIKSNVLKSLVALSKFLGIYQEFCAKFRNHGIRWTSTDTSFNSFLSIVNNKHDTLATWLKESSKVLAENERLFLKFALLSGLRKSEAITSFNMIVEFANQNRLLEYYDVNIRCLCHFKYSQYLRHSKNVYVTPISTELLSEISKSRPVSYSTIRKKLSREGLPLRIKELRSYYATYLRQHNVISENIDLIQGRVPKSVFVRHYLKLNLSELSQQAISLLKDLGSVLS
jgi:intergrase/recombinase